MNSTPDTAPLGGVKQAAQKFQQKPQLPPYPPHIKQKPKLSSAISKPSLENQTVNEPVVVNKPLVSNHYTPMAPEPPLQLDEALRKQLSIRCNQKPFSFTLMVVGASGLGKSTFINQLFNCALYDDQEHPAHPHLRDESPTMNIRVQKVQLNEQRVRVQLNLVDSPGFGDALDNSGACERVLHYVNDCLERRLHAETNAQTNAVDERVHCCLYFIQPTGHGLSALDAHLLQNLHERTCVVPVIAKADTLTPNELIKFKQRILEQLEKEKIMIYDFPECVVGEEQSDQMAIHRQLKSRIPFAVVSSDQFVTGPDGKNKRVRRYPWGEVEIDNLDHSDFLALKRLIINYHLLDMIERTNHVFYEKYREIKLGTIGVNGTSDPSKNPLSQIEEERKEYESKMETMKKEMEVVFEAKVCEKIKRLTDSESELKKREEQMERQLSDLQQELKSRKEQFERDREAFEMVRKEMEDIRSASIDATGFNLLDGKEKKKEKRKGLF